jgi:hypothetical protein
MEQQMYEREKQEAARLELRTRYLKEQMEGTPRYERARQFADEILHLMRDFLPQDRECAHRVWDHLVMTAFEANAAILRVPVEWDALNKMALEKAMLERAMKPIMMDLPKSASN